MNALGWKPGRFRIARPLSMRVPDQILKSVGFVVSLAAEGAIEEYDFEGSGFLVAIRSKRCKGQSFFYFATADHVVSKIKAPTGIRINRKGGGVAIVPVPPERWFRHPTDKNADVAVAPFMNQYPEYDVMFLGEEHFISNIDEMRMRDMGIGDEVFFPGLFSLSQQESDHKNLPIMRMGNIAMLPSFPLPTSIGLMEAYLIEARSIGGISGSPVFIRRTMSIIWNDEVPRPGPVPISNSNTSNSITPPVKALHGMTGELCLIGMIHGHWDVKESQINQARIEPIAKGGVNIGIAVVVPIYKILETLYQPTLVHERSVCEEDYLRRMSPLAD